MKFIDDVVKGYEHNKEISAFFDRCREEGVNLGRLQHYPKLRQEYEQIQNAADFDSRSQFYGHLLYCLSHPWYYFGGDRDNFRNTVLVVQGNFDEAEKQYGRDRARELYP